MARKRSRIPNPGFGFLCVFLHLASYVAECVMLQREAYGIITIAFQGIFLRMITNVDSTRGG